MTDREIAVLDAERRLEASLEALQRSKVADGQGIENKYGEAYQALVLLRARPQLRLKYRGRS